MISRSFAVSRLLLLFCLSWVGCNTTGNKETNDKDSSLGKAEIHSWLSDFGLADIPECAADEPPKDATASSPTLSESDKAAGNGANQSCGIEVVYEDGEPGTDESLSLAECADIPEATEGLSLRGKGKGAAKCWKKICEWVEGDPCLALKTAKYLACKGMADEEGNVINLARCNKIDPPTSAEACARAAEFTACAAARQAYDLRCCMHKPKEDRDKHARVVVEMGQAAATCAEECRLKKIKECGGFIRRKP